MNIAIFGGSFDPPHTGHERIVTKALEVLDIDKLLVVPTYLSPFKETFCAPAPLRQAWLSKLFEHEKKVEIFDYECNQKRQVPTVETVLHVKSLYPHAKLYLIVGSDSFLSLPLWNRYEELSHLVEFVVAPRGTFSPPKDLKILPINVNISSSKLRSFLDKRFIPKAIEDEVIAFYTRNPMDSRIEKIVTALSDKKAEDIQVFDMSGKDYFVNTVIIATTMGERHGLSLLDHLKTELKGAGESFLNVDADDNWTVIDMGDMLIHLMTPQYRQKYNLETFLKEREEEMKKVRGVE
ncbi:nicotinate (nicotinamide) nucleotide adenylyltransferase [Sulfurospirillum deleyianum]|uniref:Multifunctional fusion protein n=1 Tax=Sulfurospirillum deleyianum (strain ATCC 51133 / DSM 6946 / 5175) TaxID=525898 RepID=D1AZJ0_SULD5|nr:nicotinate (nicotinamide) nucleotide adenylyltransferase [Sulfurospirillum deleyianum]ACZ11457.1 nicotinate (nicotinamide) nucleotide adenylyltransferase [Sulfurospirillum deleyianum DSM 6946]